MKRTLILGAGFSKAIANLPLTKEMLLHFKDVLESQRLMKHEIRVHGGESIFKYVQALENSFLKDFHERAVGNDDFRILNSNYWTDFEAICTLIDLNIMCEVKADVEEKGTIASIVGSKPMFSNILTADLKNIRSNIATYLHLSLISAKPDNELLDKFYKSFLGDETTIITFNYDLILERYLFSRGEWLPHDGYGFEITNMPEIYPRYRIPSRVKILKLHGSLNWEFDDLFRRKLELEWVDDNQLSFFPGYLIKDPKNHFTYQGKHPASAWILPSWIKQFHYPELMAVWKSAAEALANADEIVVIGYSLPKEDVASGALIGTAEYRCSSFIVIDPSAKELRDRYKAITKYDGIEFIEAKLEKYL